MANNENVLVNTSTVVEDSVTRQAGDGVTANMSPATETPDIFDNTAQPAVKQVAETVPAEVVAAANAGDNVSVADVATEGATVTTPSDNINPNGGVDANRTPVMSPQDPIPQEVTIAQNAVVEDSVTHQAGDGITAGMSPSTETPDIFDNSAQPVVKKVVETVPTEAVTRVEDPESATLSETVQGANPLITNLETLSDGSVDIPRDGH